MNKRLFWLLIAISFVVQLFLSFYETHGDVHAYFIPWAQSIERYGTLGFYDRIIPPNSFANYPPLIIYILTAFHQLGTTLIKPILDGLWTLNTTFSMFPSGIVTFFNRDNLLLYSFVKLPNIVANIVLSVGIYHLVRELVPKKSKSKIALIAFVSSLFNPALIYLSTLWGQVDVLPFALVVWSFYLAHKKTYNLSIILMALALLSKQTAVLVLPFYAVYLLNKLTVIRILRWFIIVYLTFVAMFWLFGKSIWEKLFPFLSYLRIASSFASDKVSMHAHNFWQMLYPNMRDSGVRAISQIMVFSFMIFVIFHMWKKRNNLSVVLSGFGLFAVFSFMFMTRMHERHLLAAIPFLLLAVVLDAKFYWFFLFESLYLIANMYAAWPVPYNRFLADALNNYWVVNAITALQLGALAWATFVWVKATRRKTISR